MVLKCKNAILGVESRHSEQMEIPNMMRWKDEVEFYQPNFSRLIVLEAES